MKSELKLHSKPTVARLLHHILDSPYAFIEGMALWDRITDGKTKFTNKFVAQLAKEQVSLLCGDYQRFFSAD